MIRRKYVTKARRERKKKAKDKGLRIGTRRPVETVKDFPDGREVCNLKTDAGRQLYRVRTGLMLLRQEGLCGICWQPLSHLEATFDHENGRGMGGSRRDDRIFLPDGSNLNRAVHLHCNTTKGSKRGYDTTVTRHSEVEI